MPTTADPSSEPTRVPTRVRTRPAMAGAALALALGLFVLLAPRARADDAAGFERWYVVEMGGQRAGWMRSRQEPKGEHIVTSNEMRLEIKRGQAGIKMSMESEFVETPDGTPISMTYTQKFGAQPTTLKATFTKTGVELESGQNGQTSRSTAPAPEGAWLPPAAAGRYIEQRLAAGAESIVVRTIDPTSGVQPVVITREGITATSVEAMGKVVPAFKTTLTQSLVPGMTSVEYLDAHGIPIRSDTSLGGIQMVMKAADRDLALAKLDPPELMQSTFVRPDRPIEGARSSRRGMYRLTLEGGAMPDLPTTGAQRVERIDASSVRVIVDAAGGMPDDAGRADREALLRPSVMLNTKDPEIVRLTERALKNVEGDDAEKAETLRRFVHRHIRKKGLDVGFATASEVARSCEGDCSEHGALLAAMLRAAGIPSRVVSGLIYADQFAGSEAIFGYHMWTQALVEVEGSPRWLDLDATLPDAVPYDATHIAVSVSTLGDGEPANGMIAIAPLLGKLRISVEQVSP